MDFYKVVDDVLALLRRRGRVTYRALKVQFQLDDEQLETLQEEMIYAYESTVQADDRGLIWTGDTDSAGEPTSVPAPPEPTSVPASDPGREPLSYTPPYLAEKILTSRSALEGERKQVTVCFADIKDSTELIRDLDPEDAQKLLDPAIARRYCHAPESARDRTGQNPLPTSPHTGQRTWYASPPGPLSSGSWHVV